MMLKNKTIRQTGVSHSKYKKSPDPNTAGRYLLLQSIITNTGSKHFTCNRYKGY